MSKHNSERAVRRKAVRLRALIVLRRHGIKTAKHYGQVLEGIAGISAESGSNYTRACRALAVLDGGGKVVALSVARSSKPTEQSIDRFYRSFEWRKLRYWALTRYGRKCMCCGSDAGPFHVDHIKPIRRNWPSRLDETNLQILCEACNHGKGSWDSTDFRKANRPATGRAVDEPDDNHQ